jgi:hypothetical protein
VGGENVGVWNCRDQIFWKVLKDFTLDSHGNLQFDERKSDVFRALLKVELFGTEA